MSSVLSIATSGMAAASRRLEVSARNVANARSAGPLPSAPYADADGMVAMPNVDLAGEVVEQLAARVAFAANAYVVRSYAQMVKSLLDIKA